VTCSQTLSAAVHCHFRFSTHYTDNDYSSNYATDSASEMTYIVSGGGVKLYSLTRATD